jgi:eukaryotic-like serine/threonine-protein kinase
VFEVGRVGEEYFLALEYIEGRDLRRTLGLLSQRRQRLPVDLALFIGREMANGLAYAHRRTSNDGASLNLVHCDISPPNILVSFEGETKVIDFGIAKSALRGTATDPKMGFGKFGYMAPEQLIRGGIVDHRTDIYAAGVVLFELITGQRLYEAGPEPDYRALAKKVAKGEHKLPSDVDKALAPYDDLVATALRPKGDERYQSAAEFRDAIQQALVAVNPTISTDQLGAYMRELFSTEMTAQRELHDRVAKAHLEDFKDELTKETGTTVSFAVANLPLPAGGGPRAPTRNSGGVTAGRARPPTGQHSVEQRTEPPPIPTAAVPTTSVSLADGTGAVEPTVADDGEDATSLRSLTPLPSAVEAARAERRPPSTFVVLALLGGIAGLGFAVYLATRPVDRPAQVATSEQPPRPLIRVESIPPDEQIGPRAGERAGTDDQTADDQTGSVELVESPVVSEPAVDLKPDSKRRDKRVATDKPDKADKKPEIKKDPPRAELTRDAVIAKYRAARQAYEAYKSKNGGRFDQEWNDLASYVQYHPNELDELARRIESFRAKLRE